VQGDAGRIGERDTCIHGEIALSIQDAQQRTYTARAPHPAGGSPIERTWTRQPTIGTRPLFGVRWRRRNPRLERESRTRATGTTAMSHRLAGASPARRVDLFRRRSVWILRRADRYPPTRRHLRREQVLSPSPRLLFRIHGDITGQIASEAVLCREYTRLYLT
jgi:hypothetical protein